MKSGKVQTQTGKIYIVGAGPGDPELISVKAKRILSLADAVVYDSLVAPEILAQIPGDCQKFFAGKKSQIHAIQQGEINNLLVKLARAGKIVVRLKGGDPFIFGRGAEECEEAIAAKIPYEIVPGISSGIAIPAYAGIPLTHRGLASSVAFVTGHEAASKTTSAVRWKHLAKGIDTLVIYMGVHNLNSIVKKLITQGRGIATPVACIERGTTPQQRTVTGTLGSIVSKVDEAHLGSPAIIIVGEVVDKRKTLQWFEKAPLFGRTIIITRSAEQAPILSNSLRLRGARTIEFPTIFIETTGIGGDLDKAIKNISSYAWIVFTSSNSVNAFFKRLIALRRDIRCLYGVRIASIGPSTTASIEAYNLSVDVTAQNNVAEGLIESLKKKDSWKGRKVLLPRAKEARDVLPETLKKWGADIRIVAAYATVKPKNADPNVIAMIADGNYDLVTFTSSSTFKNFKALCGPASWKRIRSSLRAVSIGPATSEAIRACGIEPVAEATPHTIDGVVACLEKLLRK